MVNSNPHVCVRVTYRQLLGSDGPLVNWYGGFPSEPDFRANPGEPGTAARYAGSMSANVLGLSLSLDERGLPPGTATRVNLVAEVTALAEGVERVRPPLSVVLAVDVSGSMAGPPIEQVIQSIDKLLALLDAKDRVGVVAFSDSAGEVAPLVPMSAGNRRLITQRTHRLAAEGGTNVEAGLRRAAALLPPRGAHERHAILLLSDGEPNQGLCTPPALSELVRSLRPNIGVSTLGYGPKHNEDLLSALSEAGAGRYHFISDPSVCAIEFAQAIGTQGDVVAEGIELSLSPAAGVEIVRFLGKPAARFGAGGLRLDVPDLLEGARYQVVAELSITTPREGGSSEVMRASLTHRRAGEREARVIEASASAVVGLIDRVAEPAARASVLLARVDEVRSEARALADRGQFEGAAAVLRQMTRAVQEEPWFVTGDGSPLAEAVEQILDDALALERKPSAEQYRSFRKSQFRIPVSENTLTKGTVAPMSDATMGYVAGDLPRARLVVLNGEAAGRYHGLSRPKAMIGRTAAADIQVKDGNVSRQHALIAGQAGRFLLVDMGSTNTTLVNGQPVRAPRPLVPGDVIRVGDIEMRYEEDKP